VPVFIISWLGIGANALICPVVHVPVHMDGAQRLGEFIQLIVVVTSMPPSPVVMFLREWKLKQPRPPKCQRVFPYTAPQGMGAVFNHAQVVFTCDLEHGLYPQPAPMMDHIMAFVFRSPRVRFGRINVQAVGFDVCEADLAFTHQHGQVVTQKVCACRSLHRLLLVPRFVRRGTARGARIHRQGVLAPILAAESIFKFFRGRSFAQLILLNDSDQGFGFSNPS